MCRVPLGIFIKCYWDLSTSVNYGLNNPIYLIIKHGGLVLPLEMNVLRIKLLTAPACMAGEL